MRVPLRSSPRRRGFPVDEDTSPWSTALTFSRSLTLTLKGLFVLFLFGVLVWIAPLDRTLQVVLSVSLPPLGAACVIRGVLLGLSGLKLHLLLPRRSSCRESTALRLQQLLGIYTIGQFFTNFIPTSVGGDVMKVREMSLAGYPLPDATWSVFLERLTGILAVYGIAMFALLPGTGLPETFGLADWRYPLLGAGLVPLPLLGYLYRKGVPPGLASLADRLLDWQFLPDRLTSLEGQVSRKTFTVVLGVSLVYHSTRVLFLGLLAMSVGRTASLWGLLGAIPIITFISLLPLSLGSLGLREGAITFCLTALGLTPPEAFGVALLSRFIGVGVSVVGGIVYLLRPMPEDPSPSGPRTGGTPPADDSAAGPDGSRA